MRGMSRSVGSAVAIGAFLIAMIAPAQAGPPKSVLTGHAWYCYINDDPMIWVNFTSESYARYAPTSSQPGEYSYKRDQDRINFRTGFLRDYFGKLKYDALWDWSFAIKRDSTGATKGNCAWKTIGGM